MTKLAVAVGATTTTWLVDNDDIIAGLNYPVRLICEDEAIEVTGAEYVTFTATERTSWTVNRGVDGTTPVAHAGLTAITASTFGAGGASPPFAQSDVTGLEADLADLEPIVTNTRTLTATTQGTDTDATILGNFLTSDVGSRIAGPLTEEIYGGTTIVSVVEGVSAEMSSMAAAPGVDLIVRVSEPIPVAGRIWIVHDTDISGDLGAFSRNSTDNDWTAIGPGYFDPDGAYIARVMQSGLALEVVTLNRDGSVPTIAAGVVLSNNRIGFFNTDPVVRPQVPATPTEQDIVDALVALGLITQAAP